MATTKTPALTPEQKRIAALEAAAAQHQAEIEAAQQRLAQAEQAAREEAEAQRLAEAAHERELAAARHEAEAAAQARQQAEEATRQRDAELRRAAEEARRQEEALRAAELAAATKVHQSTRLRSGPNRHTLTIDATRGLNETEGEVAESAFNAYERADRRRQIRKAVPWVAGGIVLIALLCGGWHGCSSDHNPPLVAPPATVNQTVNCCGQATCPNPCPPAPAQPEPKKEVSQGEPPFGLPSPQSV